MPDAPTLKEIREAYSDYASELKEIQEEGRTDMRYVSGDPWEAEDRAQREDAGRPCLSPDEISQYTNQAINNIRQNKRAIQITPVGDGANDSLAERRQAMVQGIEYRSNAQDAYLTAFENAIQRSYGFARISTRYLPGSMNQEICIKPVPNPDMVIYNPNYRASDGSDMEDLFISDYLSKARFKQKYRKAKVQSFSTEDMIEAPGWIRDNYVVVAEYWKVHQVAKKLLLVDSPAGPQEMYEDELKEMLSGRDRNGKFAKIRDQVKVLRERTEEVPTVVQYITNGVEILEENEWAGTRIPIPACFGKQLFVNLGSGSKRILLSMVRLARDPQMALAYYVSQEAEEAGMAPKAPFIGAKGQFESNSEIWETITKVPRAYVEYDPVPDGQGSVLPAPSRPAFTPNFAGYEVAKESARRAVQASMGIAALPTSAQRQNEKSGIALQKIQTMEAIGAFHFTDNYDKFLANIGFQINELIPVIYDTEREVPIRKKDGKHALLQTVGNESHPLNDQGVYEVQGLDEEHLHTGQGKYDVTVSTGPSFESEREEASDFVDTLLERLPNLPVPPQIGQLILAKAIRMKNLGATGEEIADLLDPPQQEKMPPAAQAAIAQMQAQMQQLQQENAALHMDRAGRVLEQQTKVQLEGMRGKAALDKGHFDNITRIIVAMLAAKSKATDQEAQQNAERELSLLGFGHDAAHDLAMAVMQHAQAKDLASHQQAIQPPPALANGTQGAPPAQ
jgi:Phage P22-like portal protein